tara:strand:- start:4875 stop:5753 length:879 start_codon:yes stop_codon:yes gene_type:complete
MPILNNTSDGFANILIILSKFIIRHGPQKKDYLLSIFNIGINDNNESVRKTLNRWIQLDLFKEEIDQISFSDTAQNIFGKINEENLITIIRRITFLKKNNTKLLIADGSLAGDFSTGASWLLSQPINLEIRTHFNNMASQISDENKRPVSNGTRFNRLIEYMKILGFVSGRNVDTIIDPTIAIKDELAQIFVNNNILPAQKFLDGLSDLIPVLDFGSYRKEIDDYLRSDVVKKTDDLEISPSLSFALLRLDQDRKISFESRGDADKAFQFSNFFKSSNQISSFTHVNFLGNQ